MTRIDPCRACGGSGQVKNLDEMDNSYYMARCRYCNGMGHTPLISQLELALCKLQARGIEVTGIAVTTAFFEAMGDHQRFTQIGCGPYRLCGVPITTITDPQIRWFFEVRMS